MTLSLIVARSQKPLNCHSSALPLIGATTRAGMLSAPLRDRFGLQHHLDYYEVDELEANSYPQRR